jgi:hypothetical protein
MLWYKLDGLQLPTDQASSFQLVLLIQLVPLVKFVQLTQFVQLV